MASSLQLNARDPETFDPKFISMEHENYIKRIDGPQLPREAIEMSGCVGPLFWSSFVKSDQGSNMCLCHPF
jgi:hypothetical protein